MTPFDMALAASGQTLYRVVTAKGAPIASVTVTDDRLAAQARARQASQTYPGCYVEEVAITVRRRRVYRPRVVELVAPADNDLAIPEPVAVAA